MIIKQKTDERKKAFLCDHCNSTNTSQWTTTKEGYHFCKSCSIKRTAFKNPEPLTTFRRLMSCKIFKQAVKKELNQVYYVYENQTKGAELRSLIPVTRKHADFIKKKDGSKDRQSRIPNKECNEVFLCDENLTIFILQTVNQYLIRTVKVKITGEICEVAFFQNGFDAFNYYKLKKLEEKEKACREIDNQIKEIKNRHSL